MAQGTRWWWAATVAAVVAIAGNPAPGQAPAAPAKPAKPAVPPKPAGERESVTPVPRDAKWMVRHDLINSRAKPGEVDVIFLGDSITQGWEGAGKEAWAKSFAPLKAMNAGIGGDRTEHVLWRLDNGNITGITPRVAVVMIGTNNARTNTPRQIADGITAIVAKLRGKLPGTKILLLGIFPRGADPSDPLRQTTAAANDMVRLLDDGRHVFYLDIGPRFLAADGVLEKKIMPDLLHLSPEGYAIWAEAIEPRVRELLAE